MISEGFEIDVPTPIVMKRIGNNSNVFEGGEEFEKRVGRGRCEDFVAGIAQQFEQKSVGFAGAGGEDYLIGINGEAAFCVISGDGLTGAQKSCGMRIVGEVADAC